MIRFFDGTAAKKPSYWLASLFAPLDFVMLSSAKLSNRFCEMKEVTKAASRRFP